MCVGLAQPEHAARPPWLDDAFLTDAFFSDPYPLYRRLLDEAPVAYSAKAEAWLICSFQEVSTGLADPRLSSGARIPTLARAMSASGRERNQDVLACMNRMMSFQDDPEHVRLRRAVSRAFTPRRMADLQHQVQQIVNELIAELPRQGTFDLVESFAFPLPAKVICRLLGIPDQMLDSVREWADAVVTLLSSAIMSDEAADRARIAVEQADAYIRQVIDERRSRPSEDLFSSLAQVQDEGVLTADEVTAMVVLLLFAGFETTEGLIGHGAAILLAEPAWSPLLRREPELIDAFVEEVLRFDPSVHRQSRIATVPVTFGEITIEAGATILLMIGASGHDPARFAYPQRFDPFRSDAGNVGFGHGPHFCLGAPLARMETRIALRTLASLPEPVRQTGSISYGSLLAVRKPASMPVCLH